MLWPSSMPLPRYIVFSLALLIVSCRTLSPNHDAKDPNSILKAAHPALIRGDATLLRPLLTPELWSFYFETSEGQAERNAIAKTLLAVHEGRARAWSIGSRKELDPSEVALVHTETFHVFNLEDRSQDATFKISMRVIPLRRGKKRRPDKLSSNLSPQEQSLRASLEGWEIARIEKVPFDFSRKKALLLARVAPFVRRTYHSLAAGRLASLSKHLSPELLRALSEPGAIDRFKKEFSVQFAAIPDREEAPEGDDAYVVSRSLLRFPRLLIAPHDSKHGRILQAEVLYLEEGAPGFEPINPYGFQIEARARAFKGPTPLNLEEAIYLLEDEDLVLSSFNEEPFEADYLESIDKR